MTRQASSGSAVAGAVAPGGHATALPAIVLQPARLRKRRSVAGMRIADMMPLSDAARRLAAEGACLGDLGRDDHLIVQCSSRAFLPYGLRCAVSVMTLEPPAVQPRHHAFLPVFQRKFFAILTYAPRLLGLCGNAIWFNPHHSPNRAHDGDKAGMVSLIASAKRDLEGHRLRHTIAAAAAGKVDLYGRAYQPVENTQEALEPYRYAVVIENSRSPGYFTEKILDAFKARAVPIYWGDPEIGRRFNADGIIIANDSAALLAAIERADEAGYARRLGAVLDNQRRSLLYSDLQAGLLHRLSNHLAGAPRLATPDELPAH